MTTQIDICNMALARLGTRSTITSMTDGSVEANACSMYYQTALEALLANPSSAQYPVYSWKWPRVVAALTSVACNNPEWSYAYTVPADCVDVVNLIDPTLPSPNPLVRGRLFAPPITFDTGMQSENGVLQGVVWTNVANTSAVYLSNAVPIGAWPAGFLQTFTCVLAANICIACTGSGELLQQVSAQAEAMLDQAIRADQTRDVVTTEYVPDWMMTRFPISPYFNPVLQTNDTFASGFIVGDVSGQSVTPSWLVADMSLNGVQNSGLQTSDIANNGNQYIEAWTPDGRIGVLSIGVSPIGWRRPYHGEIIMGPDPGEGEAELPSVPVFPEAEPVGEAPILPQAEAAPVTPETDAQKYAAWLLGYRQQVSATMGDVSS